MRFTVEIQQENGRWIAEVPDSSGASAYGATRRRLGLLVPCVLLVILSACSSELQRACEPFPSRGPDACGGFTCFDSEGAAYRPPCDQFGATFPWLPVLVSAVIFWGVPAFFIRRAAKARGLDSRNLVAVWTLLGGLGLAYALFKGIPARTGESGKRSDRDRVS